VSTVQFYFRYYSVLLFLRILVSKSVPFRLLSKVFWMVRSLFPLLSSVEHCNIISVRNRIPTQTRRNTIFYFLFLILLDDTKCAAANTPVVAVLWKVEKM
jgi:hypothetical protein